MRDNSVVKKLAVVACAAAVSSGCATVSAELGGRGDATAQMRPLMSGQPLRGTLTRANPSYPGTVDQFRPGGLKYVCHILQTTRGSHWEVSLEADGGALAIGRGATCPEARASGWFQTATTTGLLTPTATLRFIASGGQYAVAVTSQYYGGFKITAVQVPAATGFAELPPGLRPRTDPPVGTASTVAATADAMTRTPGQVFRDCDSCPELVVLPAGAFMMGSPAMEDGRKSGEGPRHRVIIGRPFAMGRYEVTFAEYDACIADGGCDPLAAGDGGWGRERRPVINVTYPNAQRYVAWLSETTGEKYFLPSEAEWEYAVRAGTTSPWNTGDAIITADANFLGEFGKTVPVGSYPPNAFGLYDMHGNVWEWTQDCLDAGYLNAPQDGAVATGGDCVSGRIMRGGAWNNMPADLRSAARGTGQSHLGSPNGGFRVTRAL